MALRLACLPWNLDDNRRIPADDTIVRRLIAGDGATAVEVALRRLRAAGLRPPLQGACADPETARLWAAALAFPVGLRCARAMARRFESNSQKEIR
jgi:CRISPR-associated protein Csx17